MTTIGRLAVAVPSMLILGAANRDPAVIINIQRQPGANIIAVVDRVKKLLPALQAALAAVRAGLGEPELGFGLRRQMRSVISPTGYCRFASRGATGWLWSARTARNG